VVLAGGEEADDPAAAKMVPATLPLTDWLVPAAPADRGGFPGGWVLKDPARFPTKTRQSAAHTPD